MKVDLSKIKSGPAIAECIGTFTLAFAVLASLYGVAPLIATPVVAGLTLAIIVLVVGPISGAHVNPAITIGLYSLRKIDSQNAIAYIVAQIAGALLAMVAMSLFQEGVLVAQVDAVADYPTLLAEFLGTALFGYGVAAAVHQKLKGIEAAATVGGSLLLGTLFAAIASNGVLNPAVATTISSLNWAYALGPVVGSIVGMNIYALSYGKKGRI